MATDSLFMRRYRDFAAYNAWANRRLYAAAARLSEAQFRADRGAFFASVCGTLNHLLAADGIWMRRFTGTGAAPSRLDVILFEALPELAEARQAEDVRISLYIEGLTEAELTAELRYGNMSGTRFVHPLATVLDHFFNHQTHHRGQVHCLVSGFLGNEAAPPLDLLFYQREVGIAVPEGA